MIYIHSTFYINLIEYSSQVQEGVKLMFSHDHIALNVRDLNLSRQFYELLGAEMTSKPSDAFMELKLGDVFLHLLARGTGNPTSHQCIDHFAMRITSMRALELLAGSLNEYFGMSDPQKIRVKQSPPMGTHGSLERCPPSGVIYFQDPDGNKIEIRAY